MKTIVVFKNKADWDGICRLHESIHVAEKATVQGSLRIEMLFKQSAHSLKIGELATEAIIKGNKTPRKSVSMRKIGKRMFICNEVLCRKTTSKKEVINDK